MKVLNFSFLLLSCSLFQIPTFAAKAKEQSYIVYLGTHCHGPNPKSDDLHRATNNHHELLGSFLGSVEKAKESITSSYSKYINGFAANLDEDMAAQLAKHPEVVSVFLNKARQLQTTRSYEFLGLEKNNVIPETSAWKKARFGEDSIIGCIDSGVWPESKSFSDEGMDPVPSNWRGICQDDPNIGIKCNRKVIGARFYNKGVLANIKRRNITLPLPPDLSTARDIDGHGTHTISTAAGNFVANVSVYGHGYGTAKGGAPRARVASYKTCWKLGDKPECFDEDIIAAFDDAIHDGVHIIIASLAHEPCEYFDNGVAIGSFHAMMHGIVTVAAAGNAGPIPGTVDNGAPWMLTVGASTIDRDFATYVTLGNNQRFKGTSLSAKRMPSQKMYPLVKAEDARFPEAPAEFARTCSPGTIDEEKVRGKIVMCNDVMFGEEKGLLLNAIGAVGMILDKYEPDGTTIPIVNFLPAPQLSLQDGESVYAYINSTKNPIASITDIVTELNVEPSPVMASFSARGPNKIDPFILKPDVIAPGVNIIAAFSEASGPTLNVADERRVPYNALFGTSMAGPHVAGVAALLKTLHPDWSPAAIQSAIITTARTTDTSKHPILDDDGSNATPFAYGAGHVSPNRAMDPGLVFDLSVHDYLSYLCGRNYNRSILKLFAGPNQKFTCPKSFNIANFNYPSITVPHLRGRVTITRRVKNVGSPKSLYRAKVKPVEGISVSVKPKTLRFRKLGEVKTFRVSFRAVGHVTHESEHYAFGHLVWSDGVHHVKSPIAVKATKL